jgi:hypothetical protein
MNTNMLARKQYPLYQAGAGAVREPPLRTFKEEIPQG